MTGLLMASAGVGCFLVGVCVGAGGVEDRDGELRLPEGWWVLPVAVQSGLLIGGLIGWAL